MRLIDADALIASYDRVHEGPPGGARKLMEDAPTIDSSAQPEGIPLEWIDKHLEWLGSSDNRFAKVAKLNVRAMVELWKADETVRQMIEPKSRIEKEMHGKKPEEQYDFLKWLMTEYGRDYTDSEQARIAWLKGEA